MVLVLSVGVARANWTATGSFKYQDREFDQTGFTGATPLLPIRLARVEVRDANASGGNALLATGSTDSVGNYSIFVVDSKTRTIQIRALTTSGAPDLFLQVTNLLTPITNYAVTTANFANHAPTVDLNAGSFTAAIGAGGEAFNLFDVGLNSIDYMAFLNGSRPGSSQTLTLQWQNGFGVVTSSYIGNNTIRLGDVSGYNDTVLQHETGHYAVANYSATDSPGGIHHLTNCIQDLRLAFDEGFATFFGQSVRRHFDLPNPQLYVKTTGGAGPGNLDFYFDVEAELPYTCQGSTSEVSVYATLWDLADGPTTNDNTPGVDEFWDTLAVSDALPWDVMRNYIPTAVNKSIEDFWDGWFIRGEGSNAQFVTVFDQHGIEYVQDGDEANDTPAAAAPLSANGIPFHATYFKDLGNGAGTTDVDYFKFTTQAGLDYRIETTNLASDANTSLVLLSTDGITPILSNDDRSVGNPSSLMIFSAPNNATYYVKSFHGAGLGIYGSYDIAITGGSSLSGSSQVLVSQIPKVRKKRSMVEGGDTPTSTAPIRTIND